MGGAKAIIATVTNGEAMQAIAGGLGANGAMMVIGAVGALTVNSLDLLLKSAAVRGWYSAPRAIPRTRSPSAKLHERRLDERDLSRSPRRRQPMTG